MGEGGGGGERERERERERWGGGGGGVVGGWLDIVGVTARELKQNQHMLFMQSKKKSPQISIPCCFAIPIHQTLFCFCLEVHAISTFSFKNGESICDRE